MLPLGKLDGTSLAPGLLQSLLQTPPSELSASKRKRRHAPEPPSLHIYNADFVHAGLAALLRRIDACWRGQGGCSAVLIATTASGGAVLPPHSRTTDTVLVQLQGASWVNCHAADASPPHPLFDFGADPEPLLLLAPAGARPEILNHKS